MENRISVDDPLIRLSQLLKIIPVSRSTWYRGVAAGHYPKPVRLSPGTVAWRTSEVALALGRFNDLEILK